MHGHDRPGSWCKCSFNRALVDVEGVGTDVDEDRYSPRSATALALETKVNEGITTSSPGPMPASRTAISSAEVHEKVRRARAQPVRSSSQLSQRFEKGPFPDRCRLSIACWM